MVVGRVCFLRVWTAGLSPQQLKATLPFLLHGLYHGEAQGMAALPSEGASKGAGEDVQVERSYNPILDATPLFFHCGVLSKGNSQGPTHTPGEGITQGVNTRRGGPWGPPTTEAKWQQ